MATINFATLASYFETYGVMDFLLPFLLVFIIVFAVLEKTKIIGDGRKNFNVIVSFILALMFVVPHATGSYPLGYDPVQVLNATLPSISLVAVAAMMVLLLMGLFGAGWADTFLPWVAFTSLAFVVYIFGAALNIWTGPYDVFSWWSAETTELLIILAVFGLIVWFITKEPGKGAGVKDIIKGAGDYLGNLVKKN